MAGFAIPKPEGSNPEGNGSDEGPTAGRSPPPKLADTGWSGLGVWRATRSRGALTSMPGSSADAESGPRAETMKRSSEQQLLAWARAERDRIGLRPFAKRLREDHSIRPVAIDGFPASQWIVLDYLQVVVHVFHRDKRSFYSLEDLWGDAPRLEWEAAAAR